jgi:hypothetical protein
MTASCKSVTTALLQALARVHNVEVDNFVLNDILDEPIVEYLVDNMIDDINENKYDIYEVIGDSLIIHEAVSCESDARIVCDEISSTLNLVVSADTTEHSDTQQHTDTDIDTDTGGTDTGTGTGARIISKVLRKPVNINDIINIDDAKDPSIYVAASCMPYSFGKMTAEEAAEILASENDELVYVNSQVRREELSAPAPCPMCERTLPLTAHHLIPREVHQRYIAKGFARDFLNTCLMCCRPCHSAIHRMYTNKELGATYNTLEKLLEQDNIQSWISFASKSNV